MKLLSSLRDWITKPSADELFWENLKEQGRLRDIEIKEEIEQFHIRYRQTLAKLKILNRIKKVAILRRRKHNPRA